MSSETLGVVDKINNKYVEITEDNHIKFVRIEQIQKEKRNNK